MNSDADDLNDMMERIMRTNLYKADTDGDGLTDYEEYALTQTDPLKAESVKAGISDENADSDGDGLTNREEITLGSDCLSDDSIVYDSS